MVTPQIQLMTNPCLMFLQKTKETSLKFSQRSVKVLQKKTNYKKTRFKLTNTKLNRFKSAAKKQDWKNIKNS